METRILGKSDLVVSTVCFGAWPIGGGMGKVDPQKAIKTIHAAIDSGISFIDTAEGYQTSESVLGQALKSRRDSVILATKLSGPDHSESHIREALENSLSALKSQISQTSINKKTFESRINHLKRTQERLGKWGFPEATSLIEESLSSIAKIDFKEDLMTLLHCLNVYLNRLGSWIDAMIPGNDMDSNLNLLNIEDPS